MPIILKSIIGTNMKIQLSCQGTVKYEDGKLGWQIIPKYIGKSGNYFVDIRVDGEVISKRVDKLVLRYFKGKPLFKKYKEVIHIDGNKLNDLDDNLKWATKEETKNFYKEFALRPVKGKKGKGVKVIDNRVKKETTYNSPRAAEQATGIPASKIRQAIRGKQRINDFTFEYTS